MEWSELPIGVHLFCSATLSALITWLSIRYAHRRGMLDQPGQRRSHSIPTPRGGGIGIVVTALAALVFSGLLFFQANSQAQYSFLAIALVALVGWIDDHRGLRAIWRLLAHFVAAALQFWPAFLLFAVFPFVMGALKHNAILYVAFSLGIWIAVAWSINLHNFMDGINGLLSAQAIFVFIALCLLCNYNVADMLLPAWAAAVAGFLPFNFPRARVFMGDIGSGVLGLLVAIAVFWQATHPTHSSYSGIIACSAFVTDATCTLLSRMLRGRRWYSAHREHLYQWLARSGFSHAGVVALYMGWNLVVVVPVLYLVNRGEAPYLTSGPACTLAVYALAIGLWIVGKCWCLRRKKIAAK